jgi:hypothetical protein
MMVKDNHIKGLQMSINTIDSFYSAKKIHLDDSIRALRKPEYEDANSAERRGVIEIEYESELLTKRNVALVIRELGFGNKRLIYNRIMRITNNLTNKYAIEKNNLLGITIANTPEHHELVSLKNCFKYSHWVSSIVDYDRYLCQISYIKNNKIRNRPETIDEILKKDKKNKDKDE